MTDIDAMLAQVIQRSPSQWQLPPMGWRSLLQHASDNGIAPLLHQRAGAACAVPGDMRRALSRAYYASHAAHLLYARELAPMLKACATQGVPVVLLKGLALAHTLYRDPGLRPVRDADLLLRARDIPFAEAQLKAQGFQLRAGPLDGDPLGISGHRYLTRDIGGERISVELHWQLAALPRAARALGEATLFGSAQLCSLERVPALRLPASEQLFQLICHLLSHGSHERRLIWFYDLDLLARTGEVEWPRVARLLGRARLLTATRALCERLQALFATPLPPQFTAALRVASPADRLEAWLLAPGPREGLRHTLLQVGQRRGVRARLRLLATLLLPDPAYLADRYGPSAAPPAAARARRLLRGARRLAEGGTGREKAVE